jgi:endonuclease/exonuclease/phosphatase family metal-dependent hydrolase
MRTDDQEGGHLRDAISRWRRHSAPFVASCLVFFIGVAIARAERVTIATYNVENYVATTRRVDGEYQQAYPKPEEEKTALRAVIRTLDADILILQEMGPAPYLAELQRDLRRAGLDYPVADLLEGADPERHLALLSRRPIEALTKHSDLSFQYFGTTQLSKRGMLEVRLKLGKSVVTLFGLHLKSRYTDRPDDPNSTLRRSAEAVAARERVLRRMVEPREALYLVLGDFNDVPRSRPLRALCGKGKRVLAEPLAAADSRGESWTHFYKKEDSYSRVDYILASPALVPSIAGGRAEILDTPEVAKASDHRPLKVVLELE